MWRVGALASHAVFLSKPEDMFFSVEAAKHLLTAMIADGCVTTWTCKFVTGWLLF